jgi:hypothetical protein
MAKINQPKKEKKKAHYKAIPEITDEFIQASKDCGFKTVDAYIKWCDDNDLVVVARSSKEVIAITKRYAAIIKKERKAVVTNNAEYYLYQDNIDKRLKKSKTFFVDEFLKLHIDGNQARPFIEYVCENGQLLKRGDHLNHLKRLYSVNERWINTVEGWVGKSHNKNKQFKSLAHHLITKYNIPHFFDSIWEDDVLFTQYIDLYIFVGQGGNVRKYPELPIAYTKKMAHEFLNAPSNYTISQALRWGQIHGMGGDRHLVDVVISTNLGTSFNNDGFWIDVIQMFVNHPMLDRRQFGSIYDYIFHNKFSPGGEYPNFSMKGRTPFSLLRLVEDWHTNLRKVQGNRYCEWMHSRIRDFTFEDGKNKDGTVRMWTITELLNSKELKEEGNAQKHCVYSYVASCVKGSTSIWSMRLNGDRQLTVEVRLDGTTITQLRGKCNRNAIPKEILILQHWEVKEGLKFPDYIKS